LSQPTVGFIGLGQIGGPMAGRLVDWPGGLVVFDVVAEAMAALTAKGATAAVNVAGVGASAQIVQVMVRDDAQVRTVVDELLTTMSAGEVIAVHSTIRPETAEELAALAVTHGVHLLDVPVSGGFMGAADGTLAAMVGGDREAYEQVKEPFACWASLVVHMGPAGAGTRTKLARNLMHFAAYSAALEAMALAEAAGLALPKLARVVRHSDGVTGGASAIMVRDTAAPLQPDDGLYDIFCHTRELAEKDLRLALALGAELGVDLPFTQLAMDRFAANLGVPHTD
jgi:3-hydroxyisobutyrate dehydrogenase-like beta-hydroxyacid dehydrogenase